MSFHFGKLSKLLYSTKNRSGILESKTIWASACLPFEGAHVDSGCSHLSGMRACVSLRSWPGDGTELGTRSGPAAARPPGPSPAAWLWRGVGPCGAAVTLHPHGWALPSLRPTEGTVTNMRSFPQTFLSRESSLKERLAELLSSGSVTRPRGGWHWTGHVFPFRTLGRLKTLSVTSQVGEASPDRPHGRQRR